MIVEPDDAVAGPAIDSAISAPEVMVVDSVSALFEVSVSPAVGTEAPKLALPETVVRICTFALTEAASASAGTLQATVAGPVTGVGAQPVMVPLAPRKVVPAATFSVSVVAVDVSLPLLATETT